MAGEDKRPPVGTSKASRKDKGWDKFNPETIDQLVQKLITEAVVEAYKDACRADDRSRNKFINGILIFEGCLFVCLITMLVLYGTKLLTFPDQVMMTLIGSSFATLGGLPAFTAKYLWDPSSRKMMYQSLEGLKKTIKAASGKVGSKAKNKKPEDSYVPTCSDTDDES